MALVVEKALDDENDQARKRPLAELPSPVHSNAANCSSTSMKRTPVRNPYSQSASSGGSSQKKPKLPPPSSKSMDEDDDIKVLSPPPKPLPTQPSRQQNSTTSNNNNDDEDCVTELWSNVTNANVDYAHPRPHCGIHNFADDKLKFCKKCYCIPCDKPVSECTQWAQHCHEIKQRKFQSNSSGAAQEVIDIEDASRAAAASGLRPAVQSYLARQNQLGTLTRSLGAGRSGALDSNDDEDDDDYRTLMMAAGLHGGGMGRNRFDNHYSDDFNQRYNERTGTTSNGEPRRRNPKDMRIPEVLAEKMMEALQIAETKSSQKGGSANIASLLAYATKEKDSASTTSTAKAAKISRMVRRKERFETSQMDGDIAQLGLHKSFFVEGVRVGWPYPSILTPQRQMAIHLIKALKNSRHVVLESPTGTGKSAAILCAALAWQRHFVKSSWGTKTGSATDALGKLIGDVDDDEPFPRIIYCSRTHSQVEQMIASLKKTPYRPRMTVLGSRDRLCIHREIMDRNPSKPGDKAKPHVNVNLACQSRVANTEKLRKSLWKSHDFRYDDDRPPEELPGDGSGKGGPSQEAEEEEHAPGDETSSEWILKKNTKKLTCPHYRQLTSKRTARMAQSSFLLTQDAVGCCGTGGDKTNLGVHDIEELVAFGVNPYLHSNVALYRRNREGNFGVDVGSDCRIKGIQKGSAAESCGGRLRKGDKIVEVNGAKVKTLAQITRAMNSSKDPQLLSVLRPSHTAKTSPFARGANSSSATASNTNDTADYDELDVTLVRTNQQRSWGVTLEGLTNGTGCSINEIKEGGPAIGRLEVGDVAVELNGQDVQKWSFNLIVKAIADNGSNPLRLRVRRKGFENNRATSVVDDEDEEVSNDDDHDASNDEEDIYSSHAACPYYLSKELSKHAEILFAPYNYVLDPGIRQALDIDLSGSVVVLDEAHNVEGVLTESGSGSWGEIELSKLVAMLSERASSKAGKNQVDTKDGLKDISEIAHELLLFIEKIVLYMQGHRLSFENSQGNLGASKAIEDYLRFKTPDNTEFDVSYHGPNGHGVRGQAVGCKPFFETLKISEHELNSLLEYAQQLESHLSGSGADKNKNEATGEQGKNGVFDLLKEVISKFALAQQDPEHFYISCVVQANGNLDFAAGVDTDEETGSSGRRFKKKPSQWPFVYPRTEHNPRAALCACTHQKCKQEAAGEPITLGHSGHRHGSWCNPTITPRWEGKIVIKLLFPGLIMKQIANQCRTVVLASGSLSPLGSLCAELDLQDAETSKSGRLQTKPKPLEANHVVQLPKQLLAVAIGHFPDGSPLTVTYNNYRHPGFFPRLGDAIASVIEKIPSGGILVFFPSYSMLAKVQKCWNPYQSTRFGRRNFGDEDNSNPEVWQRLLQSKGKVIVEPSGGNQAMFEAARDEYAETIRTNGSCILLAVFRGKMSEGISFNDDNARGVICVGIPFPSAKDRAIVAKKAYNDEQRKLRGKTDLLPGMDWYSQEAFRAIAQALGRCIRHEADYGTVVLMDSRHCDDGSPGFAHKKLPKWMRHSVRTLSMSQQGRGANPILGGFRGLRGEMEHFFKQAPEHVSSILEQRKKDFDKAQERDQAAASERQFNSKTGSWTTPITIDTDSKTATPKITQDSPVPVSNASTCKRC